MNAQQVGVSGLAKALNLSVRWVQQLASEGVLPKMITGDLAEIGVWTLAIPW